LRPRAFEARAQEPGIVKRRPGARPSRTMTACPEPQHEAPNAMSTHARNPAAGWSWLKQAIHLGRGNPRAVFGAVALLALVAMLPSLVQVVLQSALGLGTTGTMAVMAASTLVMVVVYPLLIGGVLRVIDAAEHGRPVHATALFDTFRAGNDAGRLVGFGVAMFAAYIAVFVVVVGLFGQDFLAWYMEVLAASTQNDAEAQAKVLQDIPESFGTLMADRKSTRLNSSHVKISYAVFCLKKKSRLPQLRL